MMADTPLFAYTMLFGRRCFAIAELAADFFEMPTLMHEYFRLPHTPPPPLMPLR